MSTDNLEFAEDLEKLMGQLGTAVPARAKKISEELEGQKTHRTKIAVGASAIVQKSLDKSAVLEEEKQQMETILERAKRLLDEVDAVIPPASATVDVPKDDAPQAPVQTATVVPPVVSKDSTPEPADKPKHVKSVSIFNPNGWKDGDRAWLWALIGLVLGLIFAWLTYKWADDDIHGTARNAFHFMWWLCSAGVGFFGGGGLGAHLDRKKAVKNKS